MKHRKAAFTIAHAEERSKWRPCKGLSLHRRKYLRRIHLTFRAQGDLLQHTHTRTVQETRLASERTRPEQQEVRDVQKFRSQDAIEGEQAALSKHSEAEFHTGLLLEEQRIQIFSEAKSGRNMQESRSERADCAIRELNRQIQSHRMDIYHADQGYATSDCSRSRRSKKKHLL